MRHFNPKQYIKKNLADLKSTDNLHSYTSCLSISNLKVILDYLFREKCFVDGRMEVKGNKFYCPLTKKWWNIGSAQVCHYIDRQNLHERWLEDNCIMCSKQSNCYDSNIPASNGTSRSQHHQDFEEFLGEDNVESLLESKSKVVLFRRFDYIRRMKELLDYLFTNSAEFGVV